MGKPALYPVPQADSEVETFDRNAHLCEDDIEGLIWEDAMTQRLVVARRIFQTILKLIRWVRGTNMSTLEWEIARAHQSG